MRIAIDCRMFGNQYTGIGIYNQMLVEQLIQQDSQNQYILIVNKAHRFFTKLPSNFQTLQVNCPIYSLQEQIVLPFKLYKLKLDLVHFTNFNQPILYFKKSVSTIHDLTLFFYKGKKHHGLFSRIMFYLVFLKCALFSQKIICVSKHSQKDLNQKFPCTKGKSQTIYLGFSQSQGKAKPIAKLQNQNFLLYTGNWREHKNLPNLIRAFKILKTKYKIPHKLVLTGKPDQLYPESSNLIQKFQLQKDIVRVGLVSNQELVFLFQNAKLYVQPSFYEGFGLPILEALANQTSVCCSNTSCLPEIAQDCAHYFDPQQPEQMAQTIHLALKAKFPKEKAGKLLKKFSWQKNAQATLKIYKQCLNQ